MKQKFVTNRHGFTLIEIIVTILIVALFGAMMIVFLSDSMVKSSESVTRLEKIPDLNRVMVNMISDYKKTLPPLSTLQANINSNYYPGTYTVVENKFIQFDGSYTEIAGGSTILKVTIKNNQGETLTALFEGI